MRQATIANMSKIINDHEKDLSRMSRVILRLNNMKQVILTPDDKEILMKISNRFPNSEDTND